MAAYDPTRGNFEDYWNRQFRNDPEMQRIHAAEVARAEQYRADARASGRLGRRGLGILSESDKETAATARARAMGWAPPDHDWSVDWTDDGFRTEKRNILERNKAGLAQTYGALLTAGAATGFLAPSAVAGSAAGSAAGAPLLASSSPYLTAATTAAPPAITSAGVSSGIGTGIGLGGGGGGAMTLGRRALDFAGSDAASALGKVADWGVGLYGDRRREGVLADDKAAADLRYQAQLDLLAEQRAEDLRLDAEREARLQERWDAEQAQRQAIWDAREAQMEPYRAAGQQSLARVANLQTPTRTPYRSRFMA